MEKIKIKDKKSMIITYATIIVLVLTFFVSLFITNDNKPQTESNKIYEITENWKVNGLETSIISNYKITLNPGEKVTLTRVADDKLYKDNNLLFYCAEMGIDVFINDNQIYSLNRKNLSKKVIIKSLIKVDLPELNIGDEVRIDIYNISKNEMKYELPSIYIGTNDAVAKEILSKEVVTIITFILMLLVLFAFITFIFYASKTKKTMERRFVSFGLFVLATCIWLLTDSSIANLLPVNIELFALTSLFAFKFLPLGILYFMEQSFKRIVVSIRIMIHITFVNIFLGLFCVVFSRVPLNYTVFVDQMIFIASLLVCIIYTIKYARRIKNAFQQKLLLFAFVLFFLISASSFLCYYLYESNIYHTIISIGTVLFFICIFAMLLYFSHLDTVNKKEVFSERDKFRLLSYKDEMTNLNNKRSYDEDIDSFSQRDNSNLTLISIDINDIKRINDTYGHGTGNVLIQQCADCIDKAFNNYGKCYRTGGDEFMVIIEDNQNFDIEKTISHFRELVKASNGERIYKLSVAVGYSSMKDQDIKSIEELRFKTDLAMYKDKTKMKSSESDGKNEIWQKMIDTVVSIFEVKDAYTAQHSNRVSYLARFIAEAMELTSVFVEDIFLAGKLHDIGKIGISDKILTKKSKLNDEEFEEIKKHTIIGEKIVKSTGGMDNIANVIRHHHEKYNGSGYPDGISKDEIPLASRILAIADSIDAMTSDRCYRRALSYDECKEEIRKNVGVMYDPIVGQCVLDNWEELISIHKDLKSQLG